MKDLLLTRGRTPVRALNPRKFPENEWNLFWASTASFGNIKMELNKKLFWFAWLNHTFLNQENRVQFLYIPSLSTHAILSRHWIFCNPSWNLLQIKWKGILVPWSFKPFLGRKILPGLCKFHLHSIALRIKRYALRVKAYTLL